MDWDKAAKNLSEPDYVALVARTLGEAPRDVQDVLDALKSINEEAELEEKYGDA